MVSDYALVQIHQQNGDNVSFYLVQLFKTNNKSDCGGGSGAESDMDVLCSVLGHHTGNNAQGSEKYCLAMGISDSPCFETAAATETASILNENAVNHMKNNRRHNAHYNVNN